MWREKTFHKGEESGQRIHCVPVPAGEPSRSIDPGDVEINKETEPDRRAECQRARAGHIYEQFSTIKRLFSKSIDRILPWQFSQSGARVWSPELVNYQQNEIDCWKNNQAIGSFSKITSISSKVNKFWCFFLISVFFSWLTFCMDSAGACIRSLMMCISRL